MTKTCPHLGIKVQRLLNIISKVDFIQKFHNNLINFVAFHIFHEAEYNMNHYGIFNFILISSQKCICDIDAQLIFNFVGKVRDYLQKWL
jgi:hypothetical protein